MKNLIEYMMEAINSSYDEFKNFIEFVNNNNDNGSYYRQFDNILNDAGVKLRNRVVTCKRLDWHLMKGEEQYVSSLGLGQNPICICVEHTKADGRNKDDKRYYGQLVILFDPIQAAEAIENSKNVNFIFLRGGTINPELLKYWRDSLAKGQESWKETKKDLKKITRDTDWDIIYGSLTWADYDYKVVNDIVKSCTGMDPKISDSTPDIYRFEIHVK